MPSSTTTGDPLTWTVADVGKWLVSINMSSHCAAFATNEVDGECLKIMDDESLRAIGVSLPIHRTKLLQKIPLLFAPQGSFFIVFAPNFDHDIAFFYFSRLDHCPNRYQLRFPLHPHHWFILPVHADTFLIPM